MPNDLPHLVVLSHYPPSEGRSMAAYRQLLCGAAAALGYRVTPLTARVRLGRLASRGGRAAKWLGYLDQFLLFPVELWWQQRRWPADTMVVVSDQALGPWVPWIRHRRHLIICHDLLALDASRGLFPQQPVGLGGRLYQRWIRWGFRQGQSFAAVSGFSRAALAHELKPGHGPIAVLPNPLPAGFAPLASDRVRCCLSRLRPPLTRLPYLLHVGGYWYKNRQGVCAIYAWLKSQCPPLQLVLVGHLESPVREFMAQVPELCADIHHLPGVSQAELQALYCGAEALLFPSWLEGFGWPVLEAMACGCPVITTDRAPMREVGGDAAVYLPACPDAPAEQQAWARAGAATVLDVLKRSPAEQTVARERGLRQAARFSYPCWLDDLQQLLQPE